MRYFRNPADSQTYGYDENDSTQKQHIGDAVANKWTELTGNWPPATTAADAWAAFRAQAKVALETTSATMERITEGVSLGKCAFMNADVVAYMTYRQQLRAILTQVQPSTIPSSLPTKPAYPAGT